MNSDKKWALFLLLGAILATVSFVAVELMMFYQKGEKPKLVEIIIAGLFLVAVLWMAAIAWRRGNRNNKPGGGGQEGG